MVFSTAVEWFSSFVLKLSHLSIPYQTSIFNINWQGYFLIKDRAIISNFMSVRPVSLKDIYIEDVTDQVENSKCAKQGFPKDKFSLSVNSVL